MALQSMRTASTRTCCMHLMTRQHFSNRAGFQGASYTRNFGAAARQCFQGPPGSTVASTLQRPWARSHSVRPFRRAKHIQSNSCSTVTSAAPEQGFNGSSLTAEQLSAVLCTDKDIRVIAGPGSGKTRVLTARAEKLISQGVHPKELLILTYTNKAADELYERVVSKLGHDVAKHLTPTTIHNLCNELRRWAGGPEASFQAAASEAARDALAQCMRKAPHGSYYGPWKMKKAFEMVDQVKNFLPCVYNRTGPELVREALKLAPPKAAQSSGDDSAHLGLTEHAKKGLSSLTDGLHGHEEGFAALYDAYTAEMVARKQLDFGDQLHQCLWMLQTRRDAIYAFRGGDADLLTGSTSSSKLWQPATTTIRLSSNFRSHSVIQQVTQLVKAPDKEFVSSDGRQQQPQLLVGWQSDSSIPVVTLRGRIDSCQDGIKQKGASRFGAAIRQQLQQWRDLGYSYDDMALLLPTHEHMSGMQRELEGVGIPCSRHHDKQFWESYNIKLVLAVVRGVLEPAAAGEALLTAMDEACRNRPTDCGLPGVVEHGGRPLLQLMKDLQDYCEKANSSSDSNTNLGSMLLGDLCPAGDLGPVQAAAITARWEAVAAADNAIRMQFLQGLAPAWQAPEGFLEQKKPRHVAGAIADLNRLRGLVLLGMAAADGGGSVAEVVQVLMDVSRGRSDNPTHDEPWMVQLQAHADLRSCEAASTNRPKLKLDDMVLPELAVDDSTNVVQGENIVQQPAVGRLLAVQPDYQDTQRADITNGISNSDGGTSSSHCCDSNNTNNKASSSINSSPSNSIASNNAGSSLWPSSPGNSASSSATSSAGNIPSSSPSRANSIASNNAGSSATSSAGNIPSSSPSSRGTSSSRGNIPSSTSSRSTNRSASKGFADSGSARRPLVRCSPGRRRLDKAYNHWKTMPGIPGEGVQVLTWHACKGMEFSHVIVGIPLLDRGRVLWQGSVDGEPLYVAITRAERSLAVCWSGQMPDRLAPVVDAARAGKLPGVSLQHTVLKV